MSALARYFRFLGKEIYGYDKTETELTKKLCAEGMHICYQDDLGFLPDDIDLVVITPAIPKDQKQWNEFKRRGSIIKKRAEVLGIISRNRKCLAVAGTHGKTSTSSLLAWLLHRSGLNPSAFLGGIAENFQSNFLHGQSDLVVVEADEFDRSFLHLSPQTLILTSTDADHLDIYGEASEVKKSYAQLISQINEGGQLIIRQGLLADLADLIPDGLLEAKRVQIIEYSSQIEAAPAAYQQKALAAKVSSEGGFMRFDYINEQGRIDGVKFSQAGLHNVENATAALTVARLYGANEEDLRAGLEEFGGISRRFEWIIRTPNQIYIDDYAHHPTELQSAIAAVRLLFPSQPLTVVFQPHLYSRTRDFVEGFAAELDRADEIILLDIYPARELPIEGVSSQIIFDKMQNKNKTLLLKGQLLGFLAQRKPNLLLTVGAGDIGAMVGDIKKLLQS